ncbi:aspartate ammonia-lyase [Arthrobacter sp. KK5.5]|uniref:aspartate ammonia-lyase n=1 Tax=Arthrobacter sp. KK5.5 TaxID=3373084 RepID=UPI003EE50F4B
MKPNPAAATLPAHEPIAVQTRGDLAESIHYGSVVVLDPHGRVLISRGEPAAAFYPRSALKPIFAVGMLRAGAELTREQLALAAASHSGSARHQDVALSTLAAVGLDEDALSNSTDLPYGVGERADSLRSGRGATRLAQNCSGKHAALVALCAARGWPVAGYLDAAHPVAELLADAVRDLTGEEPASVGTDGCGTPVHAVSLVGMARAFGRIASAPAGTPEHAVAEAMRAHPDLVAGEGRDVTALMRAVPGLVAKDGFEGIQVAALPDGTSVAVKVSDGGDRARMPVAAGALLAALRADAGASAEVVLGEEAALATFTSVPVPGGGQNVGQLTHLLSPDAATGIPTRTEHDLIGYREVPADAYWGIHSLRAVENFPITGQTLASNPHLVRALAMVKQAAARANRDLGLLDAERSGAIDAACQEIIDGALHAEFVVDVVQGGAGTSTNMNANEVIANRALELLGHARGDHRHLHPNDHVNLSQSTNDVYPTAVNVSTAFAARPLLAALSELEAAFAAKAVEFRTVVKMGRTQLQDAVPMTLGQEFGTYAVTMREDRDRLAESLVLVHEINLGATAIGTALNAPPGYAESARKHLAEITGLPLTTSPDLIEATQDVGAFVHLSGVLKRVALKLSKICNDLRLLSSGPRAGLNEINLPAVQSGSSIMPGKVNPVIPEVVNQIAYQVVGNDVTISMAAEGGQLQLNAFEPIIVHSLSTSMRHLEAGCLTLSRRCVTGITANAEFLRRNVENSIGLVTALNPRLGYSESTSIALEALTTGRGVAELVLERGLLTEAELAELLQPERLANLAQ